jgi:hypothetical protein
MNKTRSKLRNSIIASKIEIDLNNIENTSNIMKKILSEKKLSTVDNYETTVYHMESFYRDNSNDHVYLINNH